jgi:hypothetical protein
MFFYQYPSCWIGAPFIKEFYSNFSAEFISIAITILLINFLYEQKEQQHNKKRLLRELGSTDKAFTSRALKELKEKGWHTDGTLRGVDLANANLTALDLSGADLTDANLENAEMSYVVLRNAKLNGAKLNKAKLLSANLENCSLKGTQLQMCNLYKAILSKSNLINSDLTSANLEFCELIDVEISASMLEDVNFRLANLSRAKFIACNLLRADIHTMLVRDAKFERCDFKDVKNWDQILEKTTATFLAPINIPNGFL